jgi:hypothetical protein
VLQLELLAVVLGKRGRGGRRAVRTVPTVLQIAEARRAYPQASASLASRREANYRIRKSYPNL